MDAMTQAHLSPTPVEVRGELPHRALRGQEGPSAAMTEVVPVFFLSDSTGISAETMGNAILLQFPDLKFDRKLFPFITTIEEARRVVAGLDAAGGSRGTPPGVFPTPGSALPGRLDPAQSSF